MKNKIHQKILLVIALMAAAALLVLGARRSHKIYDPETEEFGIESFVFVPEYKIVVDATFSGTKRTGDKLYTTYDRSEPVGKRACPT